MSVGSGRPPGRPITVVAMVLALALVGGTVEAGSKSPTDGTKHDTKYWQDLGRREHARDNKTPTKPLERDTRVYRYTTKEEVARLRRDGVPSRTHMTSHGGAGRPLSADKAQKREGLRKTPDTRVTIDVPGGTPVRKNRVMGGERGRGEMTTTKRLPPSSVEKSVPLRPDAR
jgi:hypothetical protein